jgi:hypothetical protein
VDVFCTGHELLYARFKDLVKHVVPHLTWSQRWSVATARFAIEGAAECDPGGRGADDGVLISAQGTPLDWIVDAIGVDSRNRREDVEMLVDGKSV